MNRTFSSIRAYDYASSQSPRPCKDCGQKATKDALFNAGNGITIIERYCDQCAKTVEDKWSSGPH